jgi:hypothetical protein
MIKTLKNNKVGPPINSAESSIFKIPIFIFLKELTNFEEDFLKVIGLN